MATKVQAKTYFSGSMMDLNSGLRNGAWDLFRDGRTYGSEKSQYHDSFFMMQTKEGYPGYAKEQMRQTILKQESIFRHQLQELHRLYKRQRDLMNEITMKEHYSSSMSTEAPKSSHFLSQNPSRISKETDSIFSPPNSLKGKEFGPPSSKCNTTQRRMIDLELPADVDEDHEGKQPAENVHNLNTKRACNLADLNEPIQAEETYSVFHFSQNAKCYDNGIFPRQPDLLQAEPKKAPEHSSRKRTVFGVEFFERNHTPSFDSSQSSSWDQNTSKTLHNNHWLGSNSRLMTSSRGGVPYGEERYEKHKIMDGQKNHENLEKRLPLWLLVNSSFSSEQTKGKETKVYQMNLDSLQHHSQQFFKKSEITNGAHDPKSQGIMKILGVPIKDLVNYSHVSNTENGKINCSSDLRHHIDLNMSFEEEEAPPPTPFIPESVVKTATMEIDLETPAVLESETDPSEIRLDTHVLMDGHDELVKVAAEAIMSMSSSELHSQPPQQAPADTLLRWFAEVIASGDDVKKSSENLSKDEESIPAGTDYFEYMTLKLEETEEEHCCYKPVILDEKEEDEGLSRKRTTRKGQGKRGRQRKDFQRDVLPSIVSLSRREVSEDLQTFEEAFTGIGVSWQSSLSKRKSAGKNGRGRRHLVAPPPPPPPLAAAVEQPVCREVALEEKSLSGWGKRTRRLPRQRCQNGGNHQSLALKC